jgi:hypothetical protein
MRKWKQRFYDFYLYSHLDEIDKKKKVDEYVGVDVGRGD